MEEWEKLLSSTPIAREYYKGSDEEYEFDITMQKYINTFKKGFSFTPFGNSCKKITEAMKKAIKTGKPLD